jgi:hypothetical protein
VQRQFSLHQPTEDTVEAELATVLHRYYEDKGRLPRNMADILPQLKDEHRAALLKNTPLYDSVTNQIKSEHYRNKRAKTES